MTPREIEDKLRVLRAFVSFNGERASLKVAERLALEFSGRDCALFIACFLMGVVPGSNIWKEADHEIKRLEGLLAEVKT